MPAPRVPLGSSKRSLISAIIRDNRSMTNTTLLLAILPWMYTEDHPVPPSHCHKSPFAIARVRRASGAKLGAYLDFFKLKLPSYSPVKMFFGDPESL